MAVVQPPGKLKELDRVDEILLKELERVDEILLEELERVDKMLLRIVAAIDELPERIASAMRRQQLGSVSGNGTRATEPARGQASTRPFDPYGEDEPEAAEDKKSAAGQVARKVQSWIAAGIGVLDVQNSVPIQTPFEKPRRFGKYPLRERHLPMPKCVVRDIG